MQLPPTLLQLPLVLLSTVELNVGCEVCRVDVASVTILVMSTVAPICDATMDTKASEVNAEAISVDSEEVESRPDTEIGILKVKSTFHMYEARRRRRINRRAALTESILKSFK